MRLRTKNILTNFSIILITLFFIGVIVFSNVQSELQNQTEEKLKSVSNLNEEGISNFLKEHLETIKVIATQSELTSEELNEMISLESDFYDLFVIDSNGIVVTSTNPARVGLNRANRSYFINARETSYVSPVYFALVPEQYSIAVSTPFHDGVLVGAVSLDSISEIISSREGLGETGETLLAFLDEEENIVYFSDRLFSSKKFEKVPLAERTYVPMYNALNMEEILVPSSIDYAGNEIIAVTKYFDNIGVGMVTKINVEEAFANISKIRTIIILILIIILGIFSLVIFVLLNQVSREIIGISQSVEEITKGNLEIQLKKSSLFEIQKLTDSLNRILASLKLAILRTGISKEGLGLGEAVKAKEEAENKYQLIYETSGDAIMTLEPPTWKFTSGNPATIKMFGCKDEKQFTSLTPGDLSPKYQPDGQLSSVKTKNMIETAMKEGSAFFEWTHKRYKDGDFPATVLLSRISEGGKTYLQATVRDISEQKKEQEKFKELFDSISDSVFIHDLNANFLEVNNSVTKELGYSKEQLKRMKVYQIDSPKFKKLVGERIKELKKKGEATFESAHITKSRKEIPVEIHSKVISYNNNPAILSIARDISDRVKEQEKYKTLFEKSDEAVFLLESDGKDRGKILDANELAAKMHGYSKEELLKMKITDLDVPESKKLAEGRFKRIEKGRWIGGQTYHKRKNGSIFPIEWQAGPLKLDNHIYTLAFTRDITEKKKIEDSLKESEEKFSKLFNDSPALMSLSYLKDGKFIDVNKKFEKISGFKRNEVLGKTSIEIGWVTKEDRAKVVNTIKKTGKLQGLPLKLKKKDGTKVDLLYSANIIKINGDLLLLSSGIDITDYKKEQEKYQLLAENVTDVVYTMDLKGNFTYVSPSAYKLTGYKPEEAMKMNIKQILTPESYRVQRNSMIKSLLIRNYIDKTLKVSIIRKDKKITPFEIHVKFTFDKDKKVNGVIGVARKI